VPELSAGYHATRGRIAELVAGVDTGVVVPACPAWTAHDLLAHVSGMPEALTAGDFPGADRQDWIDGIVAARRAVATDELLTRWEACAAATSTFVDAGAALLFADLVVHEHDLRGALDRPGGRGVAEVRAVVQLLLDGLAPAIKEAKLGALMIDSGPVRWTSHFARSGCTLHLDPWEATRVLASRRTADELLALPSTGDVEPYLKVLDEHQPLPERSLDER